MTLQSGAPTVLIVDDDMAFVWWLGEVFHGAGYQSLPALHCRQALTLSKKLDLAVDLVAVNPHLPGVSRMVEELTTARPRLKVILLGNGAGDGDAIRGDATLQRPAAWEPVSRPQWQRKVRRVLANLSAAALR